MSKYFKVILPVLVILLVLAFIWGPGMVQSRKMKEARKWIDSNSSLLDEICQYDDLGLHISTALYIGVRGRVSDENRRQELIKSFNEIKAPLPFKVKVSFWPTNVVLQKQAGGAIVLINNKYLKLSEPERIEAFLRVLNKNTVTEDHKCMGIGKVHFKDGEEESLLEVLPSHDKEYIDIRYKGEIYQLNQQDFLSLEGFHVFKNLLKMPEMIK